MANTSAIERLKKILALEQKQGYRNKAVIGGLERLSERWIEDAQQEASNDYQRSLVLRIVGALQAYGKLDDPSSATRGYRDDPGPDRSLVGRAPGRL